MTDLVQCAECGDRYDSEEHPFCARCGALKRVQPEQASAAAFQLAGARDPRRRRVQAAGIILLAVGGVTLLLFAMTAALAPTLVPQTLGALADQPGGDLTVLVEDEGEPVPGASVTVRTLGGDPLANGTTDDAGWANFTALEHAGVSLQVQHDGHVWQRNVLSLRGANDGTDASQVRLDTATDPETDDEWVGSHAFVQGSRIIAAVFASISAITVAGGVAAVRLRRRGLALAGAAVGLLPWLILSVAMVHVVPLLFLLAFAVALVLLRQGRTLFAD